MHNLKNNVVVNIIAIVCFLSVISQMPFLVESVLTRYVSIPLWIFLFIFSILKFINKPLKIETKGMFLPSMIIFIFSLFLMISWVFTNIYIESGLVYQIYLSSFIFFIGFILGRYLKLEDIEKICKAYFYASLIVCVDIFFNYIFGENISGTIYLYSSKNSISQILLTSLIFILIFRFNLNRFVKFLFIGFILYTLFMLKSRATLISLFLIFSYVIVNAKVNKKLKIILIVSIILISLIFLFNENILDIFIYDIILAGRDVLNIDEISSGRIYQWANFVYDLDGNWLFGIGNNYRESFILISLLTFGFPIGLMLILLSIYPTIWGYKYLNKKSYFYLLFILVSISYFINSLFEGYAPFGPGIKCFFLWFLFGILMSLNNLNKSI